MEITQDNYLETLKSKLNFLNEILTITEKIDFSDETVSMEVRSENYCDLYAKRETWLKKVNQLDGQLNSSDYKLTAQSKNENFVKELSLINSKIKETIRKILKLDEKNKAAADEFMAYVKNNIKDIKIGRNISTLYQTEIVADGGIYFDKKN